MPLRAFSHSLTDELSRSRLPRIVRRPSFCRRGRRQSFLKGAAHMADEQHTAEEAPRAEAAPMMAMPPMLAYTLRAPIQAGAGTALIKIGQGSSVQTLTPNGAKDMTYWIVILDANKPASIVQQWVTQDNKNPP